MYRYSQPWVTKFRGGGMVSGRLSHLRRNLATTHMLEDLERDLNNLAPSQAKTLLVRNAARMLPLVSVSIPAFEDPRYHKSIIFPMLRAVVFATSACRFGAYGVYQPEFLEAASFIPDAATLVDAERQLYHLHNTMSQMMRALAGSDTSLIKASRFIDHINSFAENGNDPTQIALLIENLSSDINFIQNIPLSSREAISDRRLMSSEEGYRAVSNSKLFNMPKLFPAEHWEVWTDWYWGRLRGERLTEEIARAFVLPRDLWRTRFITEINAEIERRLSANKRQPNGPLESRPAVGVLQPAALQPDWQASRLEQPRGSADIESSEEAVLAALSALRDDTRELIADIEGQSNFDPRILAFLQRIEDRISDRIPRLEEVFRLAHAQEMLIGYGKVVNEQWSDFIASRYHGYCVHFDSVMRQFSAIREFRKNARKDAGEADDKATVAQSALALAEALSDGPSAQYVDTVIPETLEDLSRSLNPRAKRANYDISAEIIEAGSDLLAYDLLESISNVLKRVAEAALKPIVEEFAKEALKSAIKEAGNMGQKVGPAARRWAIALLLGGGVVTGGRMALPNLVGTLMTSFPETFKWLGPVIEFLVRSAG